MGRGSLYTTMLILAAIDMLTSALVCGIVLFVVLVGSEAPNSEAKLPGPGLFDAATMVKVFYKQDIPPSTNNSIVNAFSMDYETRPPTGTATFLLSASLKSFVLNNINGPLKIAIISSGRRQDFDCAAPNSHQIILNISAVIAASAGCRDIGINP